MEVFCTQSFSHSTGVATFLYCPDCGAVIQDHTDSLCCQVCHYREGWEPCEGSVQYGCEIREISPFSNGELTWGSAKVEGVMPSPEGLSIQFTGDSTVLLPLNRFEVKGDTLFVVGSLAW